MVVVVSSVDNIMTDPRVLDALLAAQQAGRPRNMIQASDVGGENIDPSKNSYQADDGSVQPAVAMNGKPRNAVAGVRHVQAEGTPIGNYIDKIIGMSGLNGPSVVPNASDGPAGAAAVVAPASGPVANPSGDHGGMGALGWLATGAAGAAAAIYARRLLKGKGNKSAAYAIEGNGTPDDVKSRAATTAYQAMPTQAQDVVDGDFHNIEQLQAPAKALPQPESSDDSVDVEPSGYYDKKGRPIPKQPGDVKGWPPGVGSWGKPVSQQGQDEINGTFKQLGDMDSAQYRRNFGMDDTISKTMDDDGSKPLPVNSEDTAQAIAQGIKDKSIPLSEVQNNLENDTLYRRIVHILGQLK